MEWTRGPIIGRGSSAAVSLAAKSSSGELFAVKSTEFSDSGLLQKEKSILSQLDSPHVVKYLGFDISCEENKVVYNVFLEYVSGGTLCDLIKKQGSCLSEPMIRFCAREVLLGIDYLHSKGIVHCDIKGRNVLVSEDCGAVKIADLGCAKFLGNGGEAAGSLFSGTPAFMAPEVARGEEQGFSADVWAFGCTVIEMATGSAPWPEMDYPVSSLYRIGYSDDAVPKFPGWLSGEAKDFLSKCLNRNADDRWTATELLRHPFLQHPEKVENLSRNWNSPTSVIDQGFWESIEPSKSPIPASPIDSPANRIGRLIGSSTFPGWEDDEGWVNVREMDEVVETVNLSPIEKTDKTIFQNYCNLDQENEDELMEMEPFLYPEDLECLTGNEGFPFDCFAEEIRFSSRFGTTTHLALSHENVKDHVLSKIQDFVKNMIKILHLIKS